MYGVFENRRLVAVSSRLDKIDEYLTFHFDSIGGIPRKAEELINNPYDYDGYGDHIYIYIYIYHISR